MLSTNSLYYVFLPSGWCWDVKLGCLKQPIDENAPIIQAYMAGLVVHRVGITKVVGSNPNKGEDFS